MWEIIPFWITFTIDPFLSLPTLRIICAFCDNDFLRILHKNGEKEHLWHAWKFPVLLPGKFHGQRSLVGCGPWGCLESDTTEWLPFRFSLSCIGEGNDNPLQCSCLENPRDRRAWGTAVYGVIQSQTWLKWLSSSSSRSLESFLRQPFSLNSENKYYWLWRFLANHLSAISFSVQFSHSVMSDSLWSHGLQHTRPPCPSPTPRVYSYSCPLSRWYHPIISSSVIPFFSSLQSFPASGSFQMSQFFTSGGQSIGVSASASVLPMNIKDWFPLQCTGWISFLSKGLSRVFSNTTVQEHQFFGAQLSLWSNSHIHTWLLEKP